MTDHPHRRQDGPTLAVVGALAVTGLVFLDPESLAWTLVGGALSHLVDTTFLKLPA